jgi:hypothetical protein
VNGRCAWALLALLIASNSTLRADPLAQPEKNYVALVTLSVGVTNICDGYDIDDTNVLKFAHTRAVDIHKLGPATFNAIEEIVGMDYDRSALILDVTRIVRSVSDRMTQDVSKSGKADICDRYGKQLIDVGFLRRKSKSMMNWLPPPDKPTPGRS